MTEHTSCSKQVGRFNRYGLIGGAVAIAAIVSALLWWRASSAVDDLQQTSAGATVTQSVISRANAVTEIAGPRTTRIATAPRATESGWATLMERVAALLAGKKVEVCGLSDLDAALYLASQENAGGLTLNPDAANQKAADAALAAVAEKLTESASPREQALGLFVQAQQAEGRARDARIAEQNCNGDAKCERAAWQPQLLARVLAAAPLIKLAIGTQDPSIYALALHTCGSAQGGACASISYGDWAKLEPDNAAIWFMVASNASGRQDTVGRDEALRRAARAPNFEPYVPRWASVFDAESVKSTPPLVLLNINSWLATWDALMWGPLYGGVGSRCLRDATKDAAGNSLCDALAELLLTKDKNIIGPRVAVRIGEENGWDAARLNSARDVTALEYHTAIDFGVTENQYSCENIAKASAWNQDLLSKGMRGAARERIANTGKPVPVLIEELRKSNPAWFK